jgi:hypothetical protein
MSKSTILHTGRASLCALGEYLRRRCFFAPLREQVKVPQKTVAQFITLCSAYNLAGVRRISSPCERQSHEKRRASTMPPRSHVPQLRPSTNCYKLSEPYMPDTPASQYPIPRNAV